MRRGKAKPYLLLTLFVSLFTLSFLLHQDKANAQCTGPAGDEGMIIYNEDHYQLQYCNDTDWIKMGPSPYVPNAVTFDGGDYLQYNSDYTGLTDGDTMTASFWFKRNGGHGAFRRIYRNNSRLTITFSTTDTLVVIAESPGAAQKVVGGAVGPFTDTEWHHVMFSFDITDDTVTTVRHFYVDDVDVGSWSTWNDTAAIDFANGNHAIGADIGGSDRFIGDLADLWIDFNNYMDFSLEANRRKFINASGYPVNLGDSGERVTGSAPDVFLSGDTVSWHTNKTGNGGFTENGTISDAADNPVSDEGDFTTNLVNHWKLDETSGTTAVDSAGSNDGTMNDGLNAGNDSVEGKRDTAIEFDGVDDDINITPLSVSAPFTYAFWVYRSSDDADWNQLLTEDDTNGIYYPIGADNIAVYNNNIVRVQTADLALNTWYHIVLTDDGTTSRLYLDGLEVDNDTGRTDFNMGTFGSGLTNLYVHEGYLDDVRYYDRALSAADAKALYINSNRFCSSPDGSDGQIIYNKDQNHMQFCNGLFWVSMNPIEEPTNGLIAHWKMDDASGAIVDTIGGYDGTDNGGVSYDENGILKTAIGFDGTNDYVNVANDPALEPAQFTASLWFYADVLEENALFRGAGGNGFDHSFRLIQNSNGGLTGRCDDTVDALDAASANSILTAEEWIHAALTYDGTTLRVYKDGAEVASDNVGACGYFDASPLRIGDAGGVEEFDGFIDDVRLYNRALSADEMANLYKWTGGSKEGSITKGLVGYWPLNEAEGPTAQDYAGSNDATEGGGVIFNSSGRVESGLEFDGNDDRIQMSSDMINPAKGTFSFWFKPDVLYSALSNEMFFTGDWGNVHTANDYYINLFHSDDGLYCGINDNAGNLHYRGPAGATLSTSWIVGQWMHYVCTYDDSLSAANIRIYINGSEVAYTGTTFGMGDWSADRWVPPANVTFGNDGDGFNNPTDGALDEIRIYDRVLTPSEVAALYNAGNAGFSARDCTAPDGAEGTFIYNVDNNIMQYCDGRQWIGINAHGDVR